MSRYSSGSLIREYSESVIYTVLVVILLRWLVISPVKILSESMAPTLGVGDLVMVYKLSSGTKVPFSNKELFSGADVERGSLVLFETPSDEVVIRRVVGVSGDRVESEQGRLLVNSQPSVHFKAATYRKLDPILVPSGQVFVVAENPKQNEATHKLGLIPLKQIRGRPFLVVMSFDWANDDQWLPSLRDERTLRWLP
jgi:signal peptidase I